MNIKGSWVFLVLGWGCYVIRSGEWIALGRHSGDSENENPPGKTPAQLLEDWFDDGNTPRRGASCIIIWEPFGITHERVEVPLITRNFRNIFSSLQVTQANFPMLTSGTVGWGVEPLAKGSVGAARRWFHLETVPGLQAFGDFIESRGFNVKAAWSLYTATMHATNATQAFFVAKDFVAIFTAPAPGGGRIGSIHGIDIHNLLEPAAIPGIAEKISATGIIGNNASKSWAVLGAQEDIDALRYKLVDRQSIWDQVKSNATTVTFDKFSKAVSSLNPRNPANLWDAFPRAYPVNNILKCFVAVLVVISVVVGIKWHYATKDISNIREKAIREYTGLEERKGILLANIAEIERIDKLYTGGSIKLPKGRARALTNLGDAIPDSFTITQLNIDQDGNVTGTVIQLVDGGDLLGLATQMQRFGYDGCEVYNSEVKNDTTGPKKYRIKAKLKGN